MRPHFLPPRERRRIDWCELGWRVIPYACAVAVAVMLWVIGGER